MLRVTTCTILSGRSLMEWEVSTFPSLSKSFLIHHDRGHPGAPTPRNAFRWLSSLTLTPTSLCYHGFASDITQLKGQAS